MPRIRLPTDSELPAASLPILHVFGSKLGFVPNVIRLLSASPAALAGFVGLRGALGGQLDRRTREAIALVVSEVNGCSYCLAAHSYTASEGHTQPEEISRNRLGQSSDEAVGAAARFAGQVVETRGHVTDVDLAKVRAAGFSDAQVVDIIALSVQFMFTNLMNTVAGTEIDFPAFEPGGAS